MVHTPTAPSLLQLVIENQKIEQVFHFITACVNLRAVFLSGNKIITRDLPYMCKLTSLVKVDISNNGIHFLPEKE